jgi:catechol 2,3-dioxygenase-like lactoylglutathione lyase family enzyme
MKLHRVILPVRNIEKAVEFYQPLLDMKGVRVSPGRHYFNLGGTILACYDPVTDEDDAAPDWKPHFNQYFYFATHELERVFEKLKKIDGNLIQQPIETMPWGERLFYAKDPFGNPICFIDEETVFTGE